ncbi:hypothetical protein [Paenibacillus sp. GCM10012306]|uniref:hypothetical protein n=1 Tax=Paenibacillus sp. GCM10012306 TaxID=3317342 RepID=UPI0036169981
MAARGAIRGAEGGSLCGGRLAPRGQGALRRAGRGCLGEAPFVRFSEQRLRFLGEPLSA